MITETRKKIEVIYEKIADKTLSFGCKINDGYIIGTNKPNLFYENNNNERIYFTDTETGNSQYDIIEEIIGHPVMIGDVLDYLEENNNWWIKGNNPALTTYNSEIEEKYQEVVYLWEEKRKPIEEQSDECIEYIYSLIK